MQLKDSKPKKLNLNMNLGQETRIESKQKICHEKTKTTDTHNKVSQGCCFLQEDFNYVSYDITNNE